ASGWTLSLSKDYDFAPQSGYSSQAASCSSAPDRSRPTRLAGDVNHLPPSPGEGEMMGALCAQLSRGWKRNRAIRAALDRFESRIYDERETIRRSLRWAKSAWHPRS